jgi:hypothetical protein
MAWFTIERKADVLSLTSFLLSVIALTHQFIGNMVGPRVGLYPPNLVTLLRYNYGTDDHPIWGLNVAAIMAYTNGGAPGNNDTVLSERITFNGPTGQPITMNGYDFYDSYDVPAGNKDHVPVMLGERAAALVVVAAGDAVSHGTWFVPYSQDCRSLALQGCHSGDNFISFDDTLATFLSSTAQIEMEFDTDFLKSGTQKQPCTIYTKTFDRTTFEQQGWATFNCFRTSAK